MHLSSSRRTAMLAALLLACGSLALAIVLLARGADEAVGETSVATDVSPELASSYAALKSPALSGDAEALADFPEQAKTDYGVNPGLARAAGAEKSGWYIVPGRTGVCFYSEQFSQGGCGSTSQATTSGVLVWGLKHREDGTIDSKAGAFRVFGILPDGVKAVRATSSAGETRVAIDHNVLDLSGRGITDLKLESSNGTTVEASGPVQ